MHPRNAYATRPDFLNLARRYPLLRPHVFLTHTGPTIDFKSTAAQRRLTEALLFLDFQLTLTLPENRLCPPVPNRLNYVLWIQDIVRTLELDDDEVRGIDIGTGASAIYPLLACRLEPKWSFVATDIDHESIASARENVERNGLSARIAIVDVSDGAILKPLETAFRPFHFTMCNPPFYATVEEIATSAQAKDDEPSAVCTGAEHEMVTPGGETAFVSLMVTQSLRLKTQCRWYTSMLGKMASLPSIVDLLRTHQIDNYAITEFVQGHTRRWAIAWSFHTRRLPDSLARIANPALQHIMPARTTLYQHFPNVDLDALFCVLLRVLQGIDVVLLERRDTESSPSVCVSATDVTWSRSARRKKARLMDEVRTDPRPVVLQCQITIDRVDASHAGENRHLVYQWVDGSDRSVFESFVSHVNRKVAAETSGP